MIYPKRKKPKAASGMDMASVEAVNANYTKSQEKDNKIAAGLTGAVSAVPGYGAAYGALAGIGTQTSNSLRGSETDTDKDNIHASQITDPWFQFKDNKTTGDWASSFLLTPVSGFVKADRKQKQARKLNNDRQAAEASDLQKQSNFAYGQLSYANGGSLQDDQHESEAVQNNAVILGGEDHRNGGNSVIDAKTGEKVAETEKNEILFTKNQTETIENFISKYEITKNQEELIWLGEFVKNIIDNHTIDYSGKYAK